MRVNKNEVDQYFAFMNKCSLIYTDYIKDMADYLLKEELYEQCLEFYVKTYLRNNFYYLFLPLRGLINKLEYNDIAINNIFLPIIYQIYSQRISSDKNEIFIEKFQDFIEKHSTFKPSEIFSSNDILKEEEIFFLRYICVPEVLDVFPEYLNSINLKQERIKTLDLLSKKTNDVNDFFIQEKTRIFDELIFEQLKTDYNSSKIYVDIESLKNKKQDLYRSLYELLRVVVTSKVEEKKEYVNFDEELDIWIPVGDIMSIVSKIYTNLLDDFVRNTDYGLDKYLSADIRHGFFISTIRSSIEPYHLLTDTNNYEYEDNIFWLEKYSLVNTEVKNDINKALKNFSGNIDSSLKEANNWLRIKIAHDSDQDEKLEDINKNGLFDFSPTFEILDSLKKKIINIKDFEIFFNEIISFMWEITNKGINKTKHKIDTELKAKIIGEFQKLEEAVIVTKDTMPMKELIDNITSASYSVQQTIDTVLNWFNCVEDHHTEQYGLSTILNACVKTFCEMKPEQNIIFSNDGILENSILLTHRQARALMSSVFTALHNASKYNIPTTEIGLYSKTNDTSFFIKIKNQIFATCEHDNLLENLKSKISNGNQQLSISEGGTGLYKINNLLQNAFPIFSFNIDIKKENDLYFFELDIGVEK